MFNVPNVRDIGFAIDSVKASDRVATINSGDVQATQNGTQIDRLALTRKRLSVVGVLPFKVTVAATKLLNSLVLKLQHRSSTAGAGSTWADFTGATVSTSKTTTGILNTVLELAVDISGVKRFMRFAVTPTWSSTVTGSTLDLDAVVAVFGPGDENPA